MQLWLQYLLVIGVTASVLRKPGSRKGIFVGYDKSSPAYLVYSPELYSVTKHHTVKFTERYDKLDVKQSPVYDGDVFEDETVTVDVPVGNLAKDQVVPVNKNEVPIMEDDDVDDQAGGQRRYPIRKQQPPQYLEDYVTSVDEVDYNVDCCYRVVPSTFNDAICSKEFKLWKQAMDEEMHSLKENDTFILMELPDDKKTVGGRWVYSIKKCRRW